MIRQVVRDIWNNLLLHEDAQKRYATSHANDRTAHVEHPARSLYADDGGILAQSREFAGISRLFVGLKNVLVVEIWL